MWFTGGVFGSTTFVPTDLNPQIQKGWYTQKVRNFFVILDISGSMLDPYTGISEPPQKKMNDFGFMVDTADPFQGKSKSRFAREIVRRFLLTIPDIELEGGIRTVGKTLNPFGEETELIYGFGRYDKAKYLEALDFVRPTGGKTPLEMALDAAGKDMETAEGDIALVIVSDGKVRNENVFAAVNRLKNRFGGAICIHTIFIGENPEDRRFMENISQAAGCGISADAEVISDNKALAEFVASVFLETPKVEFVSADIEDGVEVITEEARIEPRSFSEETDVPESSFQAAEPMPECIFFTPNQWRVHPMALPTIEKVTNILTQYPAATIHIHGHTDDIESKQNAFRLSQHRADAVKKILIDSGIRENRIFTESYEDSRPRSSNISPVGQAMNRRVELTIIY